MLAHNDVFDSGLSVLLDAFDMANVLATREETPVPPFEVALTAMRRRVRTHRGLTVPVSTPDARERPDVVVVPALGAKTPPDIDAALAQREISDVAARLRLLHEQGARVAAACTATFLVARTGLLDRRSATTTWWLAPFFRERFPLVHLDETRLIVRSQRVMTAGAAVAHLDLALAIIRQQSPAVAARVARYLVVEPRASQAPFVIPDQLEHADPVVERFERWVRRRLAEGFELEQAARACGVSPRTLARRLRRTLGKTPVGYVQDLRVERASHLLRTTRRSVEEIAGEVGYGDATTLRTLLRRRLGRGVRELRR